MKRVDVAYTLLFDENTNKVLMVLNRNKTWSLPGGAVEVKETLKEAAIREVKEETGYDVTVSDIIAVNEAFINENHVYFITFQGQVLKSPEEIPTEENILKVEWVDLEEADRLMPYHPEGVSKLIRTSGARYILQK
ncbi:MULTISPECIES: NUDIX hydrolase [Bacillaceae]|uniref:NUDIX hydrolase n=1 Tax=Bacillaceae TaxID=186817 RepID=UPI0008F93FC8|nr:MULTISPECIES: NUDIX hydrolase [Bacillaceae]GLB61811.1 DNA mismatch repair protein MutT [Cytobacillus sp. NCCP-133]